MINVNDVLAPAKHSECSVIEEPMVVVWCEAALDRLYAIRLRPGRSRPVFYRYHHVVEWIEQEFIEVGELMPTPYEQLSDGQLTPASIYKRDQAYASILPIIENLEAYLVGQYGSKIIRQRAEELAKQNNTRVKSMESRLYERLYRYLRGGQTKAALTPHYGRCGKGERSGDYQPLGRPPSNAGGVGKNVTQKDKEKIWKTIKKHRLCSKPLKINDCY